MRLFHALPILSFLFGAHASSLDSRQPGAHPLDARDLDVCALVNQFLVIPIPAPVGPPVTIGLINSCICLSGLPQFLVTNPVAKVAVELDGEIFVTGVLTNLIEESAAISHCTYPVNSVPACVNGKLCGFTCTNGFSPSPPSNPTTCVCIAPNRVCNGQCRSPGPCPSGVVTNKQRRWVGSGSCTEMGSGWAACGVIGGGALAWECVHTTRDLESCGGCALPLTPFSPIGQDCTALPGVADVTCQSGKCSVRHCMSGYVRSHDGTRCTATHEHISRPHATTPEEDESLRVMTNKRKEIV